MFRLPSSIRRKKARPETGSRPRWSAATSSPIRKPYGSSRISIFPPVDVRTPSGPFVQLDGSSPSRPVNAHSPTRIASLHPPSPPRSQRDPRRAQWQRWTRDIIPSLVPVFLEVLRSSDDLRNVSRDPSTCGCMPTVRKLTIVLVSWEGLSSTTVCSCKPVALLLRMGYLASAPLRPTYAFDIQMLDFVRLLHLRSPPNKSAWTSTLEAFLLARGYTINGADVIRRKFTAALKWYTLLHVESDIYVRKAIVRLSSSGGTVSEEGRDGVDSGDWEDVEDVEEGLGEDGMAYLARCCPCCFGGDVIDEDESDEDEEGRSDTGIGDSDPDVVVCLDACFTQKRRTPVRGVGTDPPLRHPRSVVLTEEEVLKAEEEVERRRPSRQPPPIGNPTTTADKVERGMKVPASVLDACNDSFKAADEKRTKASTKYFADTGLMALLCRHDRVLWIANMKTAGERQYFRYRSNHEAVRASSEVNNGRYHVRYRLSIGTKLQQMGAHADAVTENSLVYHPRKRKGFGLSDGEGCERFWSAIEFMIPTQRVSGYHQRIFNLDVQVAFLRDQSLLQLGSWVRRKSEKCSEKRSEAIEVLGELTFDSEELEHEWELQVSSQTRPLTRATNGLAKKSIKAILTLMEFSSNLAKDIQKIDKKIARPHTTDHLEDLVEMRLQLGARKEEVDGQIDTKRKALGLREQEDLQGLVKNKYMELRLKTLAVKERLRAKLQGRKFELERVDRAYQQVSANEKNLRTHIETQVGRHQGTITTLFKRYNEMCADLEKLIRNGKAPAGSLVPRPIPQDKLYSLDVDGPIWDDTGLNDVDGGGTPQWLGNDDVRVGILSWLEAERCGEERRRLERESLNLQSWALRESVNLVNAFERCDNESVKFQIARIMKDFGAMTTVWKSDIRFVSRVAYMKSWGGDLLAPHGTRTTAPPLVLRAPEGSDSEGDPSGSENSELEADDRVMQALEAMQLLVEEDSEGDGPVFASTLSEEGGRLGGQEPRDGSPRKRRRAL
ncbi:hypothetical protein DFP72DRAFT_1078101 [Ephemerocybe angulata]|uniref:CxC1-like cysteine cluster associated with KDZ transposases domain-containing protein n=1 Tax=Ephemerocybe angulata TaxID=980116 RepID=A0A8H6LXG7_9AGAR|nr:hypothetical protein DFP72DRAFT_1078101 [Tulosesus angulatus]